MPRFVGRAHTSNDSPAPVATPPPHLSDGSPAEPKPAVSPQEGQLATAITPKVSRARPARRRFISTIPTAISENPLLRQAMQALPSNYNFEVQKTIWRIRQMQAHSVALQFPEGLLLYACTIADIIEQFALEDGTCEVVVMGDVTYGACCVDDLCAAALGCELLVHYGHSCLVPIDTMATDVMYVFVEVSIDTAHLLDTIRLNFKPTTKLALCGTIQFGGALHSVRSVLKDEFAEVKTPQAKPLSAGEVLGCTSPTIEGSDACIFIADGRFHPEAVMVANPNLPLYRYDPYSKTITHERYEHEQMHSLRRDAIKQASTAKHWGIVMGTLGRQGNPAVLQHLQKLLKVRGLSYSTLLLSEVFPAKLAAFGKVDAWIQVCCPRLSMDWGHHFAAPLLSPYEAEVALAARQWQPVYPMDNYAKAGGSYSNYASEEVRSKCREECACVHDVDNCDEVKDGREMGIKESGDDVNTPVEEFGVGESHRSLAGPSPPVHFPSLHSTCTTSSKGAERLGDEALEGSTPTLPGEGGLPPARPTGAQVKVFTVPPKAAAADSWVLQCSALERKCFAKHEAMNVATEVKARNTTLLCAALGATECVGYCVIQRSSLVVNIVKLVVAPHCRRQGIGRALLAHAVESARAGRAQACTLHVDTNNEPAKQLYLSLGFSVSGRRDDYYKPGRHAFSMELQLEEK